MAIPRDISVIIPFYNRVHYLSEAVSSVFAQSFADIQLILVDDGSEDDSLDAASGLWEALCERDNPAGLRDLVRIRLDHSGMPGLVRNRGVEAADSSLVAFLDSDDIWLPEKLRLQMTLHSPAADGGYLISHTRERWLRVGGNQAGVENTGNGAERVTHRDLSFREVSQKSQKHRRRGDIFSDALWKCTIGPSTVVMDRALYRDLGGFREDLQIAEDYEFWLRVTAKHDVGYIDEPCIEKRAGMPGQDQLSERFGQIEGFRIRALQMFLEGCPGSAGLSRERRIEAWKVLERKAGIHRNGALKRGLQTRVKEMDEILARCRTEVK